MNRVYVLFMDYSDGPCELCGVFASKEAAISAATPETLCVGVDWLVVECPVHESTPSEHDGRKEVHRIDGTYSPPYRRPQGPIERILTDAASNSLAAAYADHSHLSFLEAKRLVRVKEIK